jgi:hypothetical protein
MAKIIGTTTDGFLVELSHSEMWGVFEGSIRNDPYSERPVWQASRQALCGATINFTDVIARVTKINKSQDELRKVVRQLRAVADVLEPLEYVVGVPLEGDASDES